jgi:biotin carboxyl carrier protein
MGRLLANPHLLAGFLGRYDGELWTRSGGEVAFAANPMHALERLYHFLDMEDVPGKPPSEKLWDHDQEILGAAFAFYGEVARRKGFTFPTDWKRMSALFEGERDDDVAHGDVDLWQACVASHRGFQIGLELLLMLPRIGIRSGFLDVTLDETLRPAFPDRFLDADAAALARRALAPPPAGSADEIVTPMGGTFYAREAPHLPLLVEEGQHFEAGQPLFVIEVMKMFNKVVAPFSGTVVESFMKDRDGTVVAKGQVIFRIEPDERFEEESPEAIAARVRETTRSLLPD